MSIRADDWTLGGYCQAQCAALTGHHTGYQAGVLDRLDSEHLAIHDLLTDTLLSHFAYEERELAGPPARFGMYPGQV